MKIRREAIIDEVKRLNLPLVKQSAFWKVERPPFVLHFANTQRVSRVHLKGFENVSHRAIRRVSTEEANERHLGKVSAELDSSQPEDVFRDGLFTCLRVMAGLEGDEPAPPRAEIVEMTIAVDAELAERIDSIIEVIPVPPGIQVTRDDAVRYLLHQGIEVVSFKAHLLAMPDVGRDEDFAPKRSFARRVDL